MMVFLHTKHIFPIFFFFASIAFSTSIAAEINCQFLIQGSIVDSPQINLSSSKFKPNHTHARAVEMQKYILYNYRNLIEDFSREQGIYLNTLLAIADVRPECRTNFIAASRTLLKITKSKNEFAKILSLE